MAKRYAPHEPEEDVFSPEDAFRDAEQSEARWKAIAQKQRMQNMLVELPEPLYLTLDELARRQNRTAPRLVEDIIRELLFAFVPSLGREMRTLA